ncbi:xanthine dehydrogenase family protein molybdopterin-binding subunit [Acuticoccus kandeliae]|uniref:xanthine dehydrogenase family protein molybdopterin-binding subunit n=1 Tax=Acuticoccus kandeliae TaxID=2073160 RepID=UPI000D3E418E|nr:xanthine dehydrogenase family protein molybdopterin-binding subunit [Acuticoccus kandeliae]
MTLAEAPMKRGDASDGGAAGPLGRAHTRADGPLKVRGAAPYALEHPVENPLYCAIVQSTVGAGRLVSVDRSAAEASPGVRLVLDASNTPSLSPALDVFGSAQDRPYRPFLTDITHNGQLVAAVVADTREQAVAAAALVRVEIETAPVVATFEDPASGEGDRMPGLDKGRGEAEAALAAAEVTIEATYHTPREYNTPIEPHGLIVEWNGPDRLTVYEPSQWVDGMARTYAEWFDLPFENVRIVSPFIGGGFGSKARAHNYSAVSAIAARQLGRPVKLALTRPQTFTAFGGRPSTRQTLKLGATKEGHLVSIVHEGASETSIGGSFVEPLGIVTGLMYKVPNFSSRQNLVHVNTVLPGAFRAPGKNPSAFGLECAMDELAYALGIDPLELRLRNEPEVDPESGKAWSTRRMREAYEAGAAAFGWADRRHEPGTMRRGRQSVGWGMACGTHPVYRTPGEAMVRILADGSVEVLSSSTDMGTGTYTILAQTAADVLGVPVERVSVSLGDSRLPRAPVSGGSQLANLMTGAVHVAASAAREELIALGLTDPASPLRDQANTLELADGMIGAPRGAQISIAALMAATGRPVIETRRNTLANPNATPEERFANFTSLAGFMSPTEGDYSRHSWCAHFVEVLVDEDFGTVRVSRVVSALDAGRLYNPKLADSQFKGGIVMGIGQALLEEGVADPRNGRILNANLADYRIATNADVPDIETISVGIPDPNATLLGGKAVGELAIVGMASAIANAVHHATGKRVRRLPITLDRLI